MMQTPPVFHIDRLDLSFAPKPWAFADERRAEIDAYFNTLTREKPDVWNGRVLLMYDRAVENGVLRGQYLETDYASFSAWCHWDRPAAGVGDCFSAAAIMSADGAFLLGVMSSHTFNGGRIYFPCGTPDPGIIVYGDVEPGWTMSVDGALIAQIKVLRSNESATALRERILEYLASEKRPELADIRIVRGPGDFDPAMPGYAITFLRSRFGGR